MKVSELTGALLDYWIAHAHGYAVRINGDQAEALACRSESVDGPDKCCWKSFAPSTDWAQGGPIIERIGIGVVKFYEPKDGPVIPGFEWAALSLDDSIRMDGPTPLIAAMRAYVASKFGEEVPDEALL
jgi:Protein of unknown function (DUF2591)